MVLTKKFRNIGLHDRLTLVERGTRRMRIAQALLAECSDRKIVSPIEAALGQCRPLEGGKTLREAAKPKLQLADGSMAPRLFVC